MSNLNLNKVTLGGRLTSDITLKQTPQGVSVCTFTLAVNRKGKDAQTDFINCVAWRGQAELLSKYFKKGSCVCICGSIQTRTWEADGQKRYATEVIADEVYFVDSKTENEAPAFPPQQPKFEEISSDDDLPF